MSNVINIYTNYTPRELSDLLMSEVAIGDAHELHNACIALCEICSALSARIAALEADAADLPGTFTDITPEEAAAEAAQSKRAATKQLNL